MLSPGVRWIAKLSAEAAYLAPRPFAAELLTCFGSAFLLAGTLGPEASVFSSAVIVSEFSGGFCEVKRVCANVLVDYEERCKEKDMMISPKREILY